MSASTLCNRRDGVQSLEPKKTQGSSLLPRSCSEGGYSPAGMRLSIIQRHSFGANPSKLWLEMPENYLLNWNSTLMVIPLFFLGGGGKGGGLSRRPDIDILKSLEDAVKQLTNSIQRH